jgi:hypothetical protein
VRNLLLAIELHESRTKTNGEAQDEHEHFTERGYKGKRSLGRRPEVRYIRPVEENLVGQLLYVLTAIMEAMLPTWKSGLSGMMSVLWRTASANVVSSKTRNL